MNERQPCCGLDPRLPRESRHAMVDMPSASDGTDGVDELTVGSASHEILLVRLAREAGWPVTDDTEIVTDDKHGDHVLVLTTDNGSARLGLLHTGDAFKVLRYISLGCVVHEDSPPEALKAANLPYTEFLKLTKQLGLEARRA